MNQKEVIESLAAKTGLPKTKVHEVLNGLSEIVENVVTTGQNCDFSNLHVKSVKVKAKSGVMNGKKWSTPAHTSSKIYLSPSVSKKIKEATSKK
jgi:nucleoid DNA-binding protein